MGVFKVSPEKFVGKIEVGKEAPLQLRRFLSFRHGRYKRLKYIEANSLS